MNENTPNTEPQDSRDSSLERLEKIAEKTFRITRRLTRADCPWFDKDEVFNEGDIVYDFWGYTYGCISESGMAVSKERGQAPFVEIPLDALGEVPE